MKKYDRAKLEELWAAGKSSRDIAEELGIPITTVSSYIHSHRDKCQKRERSSRSDIFNKLEELWNSGRSAKEIALELDLSEHVVKNYVNTHRENCNYKFQRVVYDGKKIAELWNLGKTRNEIAE